MRKLAVVMLVAAPGCAAGAAAADFELRVIGGSVQLGTELVLQIRPDEAELPEGASCTLELPPPYDGHVTQTADDCSRIVLKQSNMPILDDAQYAIPSTQVPAVITVTGPDGARLGQVDTVYPYNNQFSDLRILIRDVRNPVAEGESFDVEVQGALQPIAPGLTCRWNTYGPVRFDAAPGNGCSGTLTALAPTGRDADMDVQIVNLTDMHAVGYATASMIVE
ncbi:MAG: hypothetical protein ACQEVT_16070 [Pseudomonadota bacterium]|uniref:hypothetical protein n=1 Tax=Roseovarius TaxID=74030 RepID=UPI0022A880EF|nr:hypothetical protein [Roseovarius sp. EGI FJ00037]MCZ0813184.1 hypothetical protein [Roseovarius sp. EGI FJ00037]